MDSSLLLFNKMLWLAATVASPVLICSLVVGLIISILQVVTQIQEMTLTFVPKIVAAVFIILAFGHWMLYAVIEFTHEVFRLAAGM